MRLSTLKDLLVVASLFAAVAWAGTSVVHAVSAPASIDAAAAAPCVSSNVVALAADAPDAPPAHGLRC